VSTQALWNGLVAEIGDVIVLSRKDYQRVASRLLPGHIFFSSPMSDELSKGTLGMILCRELKKMKLVEKRNLSLAHSIYVLLK